MSTDVDRRVAEIMRRLKQDGVPVEKDIYPNEAQLKSFLGSPDQGKFYVVSMIQFTGDPISGMGGEPALQRYQERTQKLGIKGLLSGEPTGTLIGPSESIPWNNISIMECSSPDAFIEYYLGDPELQKRRSTFIANMRSTLVKASG